MDIPYIPYFTTSRYRVAAMVELAQVKPGEKVADLGTGDGRIAIAFAKAGAIVDAYELDEEKIQLAKKNITNVILGQHEVLTPESEKSDPGQARMTITPPTILKKDFWYEDLSHYSIITCYPMPTIMGRLEHKLMEELKPGSRVLLNYFPFLHWKEAGKKDNVYLYKK